MKEEIINHQQMIENLKNPSLDLNYKVYHNGKGRTKKTMGRKKNKYTLNQLGETVDKLVITVATLAKTVDEGFKRIDTRLDYIVKANNLKDLPSNNRI